MYRYRNQEYIPPRRSCVLLPFRLLLDPHFPRMGNRLLAIPVCDHQINADVRFRPFPLRLSFPLDTRILFHRQASWAGGRRPSWTAAATGALRPTWWNRARRFARIWLLL